MLTKILILLWFVYGVMLSFFSLPPFCFVDEPHFHLHDHKLASASGSTSFLRLACKYDTFCLPSSPCFSACHFKCKAEGFLFPISHRLQFQSQIPLSLFPRRTLPCSCLLVPWPEAFLLFPCVGCQMCTVIFLHWACCPNAF